jgi:pyruvate/2-oxoglutarate dehydrogenase complex dihydrolipoamide acyltransferase (E2) component
VAITQWLKKVGDYVEAGEMLFEISTDKVEAEIPSPFSGILTEIKVKEGKTVPISTVVAVVGGVRTGISAEETIQIRDLWQSLAEVSEIHQLTLSLIKSIRAHNFVDDRSLDAMLERSQKLTAFLKEKNGLFRA